MAKALARGDGYDRIRGEIARRFVGQSVSNIMRVVQTEGTYVSRQAQGAEMRRAGFDSYFIDSRHDGRTCPTCRAISKRSHEEPFRFEDARVGENYPPLHPRCRCDVNPAVGDWDEWLGARRRDRRAGADPEREAERFEGKMLRTRNDPAVDYYGKAEDDDPRRLRAIKDELRKNSVSIVVHGRDDESMGYSPCSRGMPGTSQMHVTEGMSLLAWEHEYDHFLWDKEHGYPGIGVAISNRSYRLDAERRAYGKEIEIASSRGDNELIEKLKACWRRRRAVSSKTVVSRAESIRSARGYDAVSEAFEFVMSGEPDDAVVSAIATRKNEGGALYSGMTVGTYMRIFLDILGAEPLDESGTLAASWRDNLRRELAA